MDIEKEIELLEILESIPMPPDPAPMPISKDGFVTVPFLINKYFKKIGVKLDLDQKRKMKIDDYLALMAEHHITMYGIIISTQIEK